MLDYIIFVFFVIAKEKTQVYKFSQISPDFEKLNLRKINEGIYIRYIKSI